MWQLRNFNLKSEAENILTNNIINLISAIHEYKGKQTLYIEANHDILTSLLNIAKIQSTESSNKIEGIKTTDERINALVNEKVTPKNRNEEEIAGYRDVLELIHENYENMDITPNVILQMHKYLYKYSSKSIGGKFKDSENIIEETDEKGIKKIRFKPLSAFETPQAMNELCTSYNNEINANEIDPLFLIPIFILDFLSIHPFNDGNGRMSRLLTLLLFYKAGYIVGKYVSMEMLIEKTKETYYEALQASSVGWHEGENSYEPFVKYYLGIMLKAYNEFESRVEHLKYHNLSKPDRIKAVIDNKVGKITKKEIMELCPDISKVTVERTLTDLVKSGYIAKVGAGPSTGYVRI